ncbi:unnamed protein product [Fraxinus pennsylvanica]|uniref:Transcription factor TFIIIC triple barrel domain-containing protein n=1 Tax=Fraxinus pennsylvanica TaxID=56036 RepID=A0AAD1ZS72_9LAMI|nr:unnamed protein product [Fraxinus pennsylvanica]
MEGDKELEEEECVLIDLDGVADIHIPPNAPYVLSGLDTLNPILVIDNKIKLIGEYEETIGTCLVFNETDAAPVVHEETGSSEGNLFAGKCIVDPKSPGRQVKPIARLHKGLDTLNPILVIDNKIKLIGEYEETIGTCLVFNETDAAPVDWVI